MAFKQRTYTEVPTDEAISPQIREFLTSLLSQVNALSGQGNPTSGAGIAALSVNMINPTTGQIISAGARTCSVTSDIGYTAATTGGGVATIKFFWDGTNSSGVFQIRRDDGTVQLNPGDVVKKSPLVVTNLAASTLYFFFPYWDETLQSIVFPSVAGAVGSPAVAYTMQSIAAKHQQILRNRIQLTPGFGFNGITTPAANGSGGGTGGSGGGAGVPGGGGGGHFL